MDLIDMHKIVISKTKTMPILGNVLVNGKMISTDLDTYLISDNPGLAPGVYTIKGKNFYKTSIDAVEFPSLDIAFGFTHIFDIDTSFLELIKKANTCVPTKPGRPSLSGVCFDLDRHNLVATDGCKMFIGRAELPGAGQYILNSSSIIKLIKLGRKEKSLKVFISSDKKWFRFDASNFSLMCRFIADKYPDYLSVIPSDGWVEFTYNRLDLLNKVNHCSEILDKNGKLTFYPYQFLIKAENINEDLDITEKIKPKKIKQVNERTNDLLPFAFNHSYLIQVLNLFDSDFITFLYKKETSAFVFSGDKNKTALLMPARVSS